MLPQALPLLPSEVRRRSGSAMRIAFDLDDTLIPSVCTFPTERPPRRLLGRLFCRIPVRLGTTRLLRALTNQGHDLWIYTTSLRGRFLIRQLVNISGVAIGGVIAHVDGCRRQVFPRTQRFEGLGIEVVVGLLDGIRVAE